jgi:gag-polypeptide of LTR copia-type
MPWHLKILYDRKRSKISSLIINSLGNKPLSIIQSVSKDPVRIWMKLEERYASKSINSKLSFVTELQNKKFTHKGNMSDHVEEFDTLFAKLENAGHEIEPLMQVSMFLASLEGHSEYNATIAAVRTLARYDIKWEIVTTRLRDEYKNKQKQYGSMHGSLTGSTVAYVNHSQKKKPTCKSCGKMGHNEPKCW